MLALPHPGTGCRPAVGRGGTGSSPTVWGRAPARAGSSLTAPGAGFLAQRGHGSSAVVTPGFGPFPPARAGPHGIPVGHPRVDRIDGSAHVTET